MYSDRYLDFTKKFLGWLESLKLGDTYPLFETDPKPSMRDFGSLCLPTQQLRVWRDELRWLHEREEHKYDICSDNKEHLEQHLGHLQYQISIKTNELASLQKQSLAEAQKLGTLEAETLALIEKRRTLAERVILAYKLLKHRNKET